MNLLSAPCFYALLEFAYLSRLPTCRLTSWGHALLECWPGLKNGTTANGVAGVSQLKPTYICDWRKSVLRSKWFDQDRRVPNDKKSEYFLDFRFIHYELRCQHWAGDHPNAIMFVFFERNTETLFHEIIKLSHVHIARLGKLVAERVTSLVSDMQRVLNGPDCSIRFSFPSGTRRPDLYAAIEERLSTRFSSDVSIVVEHYRSRMPLKFRPLPIAELPIARVFPPLKKERVSQRQKMHLELYRFADKSSSEAAYFWRSMSEKVTKYFKAQASDRRIAPCWIDLTKRSAFETDFSAHMPKKMRAREDDMKLYRDCSDHF